VTLSVSFPYSGAQSAAVKLIETIIVAGLAIFNIYLNQIYFASKYLDFWIRYSIICVPKHKSPSTLSLFLNLFLIATSAASQRSVGSEHC